MSHYCNKCNLKLQENINWTTAAKKKWDYTCNTCRNIARQNWEHTLKGRYIIYRRNAKKRGLEFSLSLYEFTDIILKPCYYCGKKQLYNGVDRVDNSKGYIKSNCKPCCTICNKMKGTLGEKEFTAHCKKVIENG